MDKLKALLKSRTAWVVVIMFIMNNMEDIKALLPQEWMPIFNLVLAGAAMYFRVNPSQTVERSLSIARERKLQR